MDDDARMSMEERSYHLSLAVDTGQQNIWWPKPTYDFVLTHTQAQCDFQSSPLTVLLNPFPSIHQSQQTSSSSIWPVETYQTTLAEKMMIYLTSLSSELLNELITWTSVAQVEDVKYSSLTTLTAWIGVGIDHQGLKSLGLEMAMILS